MYAHLFATSPRRSLAALLAVLASVWAVPAQAQAWEVTAAPLEGVDDLRFCLLRSSASPPRLLFMQMSNGLAALSAIAPQFAETPAGSSAQVTLPDGGQFSVEAQHVQRQNEGGNGVLILGLTRNAMNLVLDRLKTPGTLTIGASGQAAAFGVPELAGQLAMMRSCTESLPLP